MPLYELAKTVKKSPAAIKSIGILPLNQFKLYKSRSTINNLLDIHESWVSMISR
jgi:hypothetical protein